MPFDERLNYFFLYLKKHIESTYALEVERGDSKRLTKPVAEKLTEQIRRARLIIADVTGSNPNVLYEVGLAHAFNRPVIFLTQDAPEAAPFDLRHFDFITYELGNADRLINELDTALRAELADQFGDLYERACDMLAELNRARGSTLPCVSRDVFYQRISPLVSLQRLPDLDDKLGLAEVLLPRVAGDSTDMQVIRALTAWMDERFASSA